MNIYEILIPINLSVNVFLIFSVIKLNRDLIESVPCVNYLLIKENE